MRRLILILWLVVGVAVWNGVFDLYISRGSRIYLEYAAESALGDRPEPSMVVLMSEARHRGALAASIWTAGILAAAWVTWSLSKKSTGEG